MLSVEPFFRFGLIKDVIVLDVDDYFLVCEVLETECFNSHFHAYEVSRYCPPSFVFVKQVSLADHSMLGLYKKADKYFIALKYLVVSYPMLNCHDLLVMIVMKIESHSLQLNPTHYSCVFSTPLSVPSTLHFVEVYIVHSLSLHTRGVQPIWCARHTPVFTVYHNLHYAGSTTQCYCHTNLWLIP